MDVSPKTLREVEFREKMRGYHPEDVDQFLERMAAGVEVLQDRLRQAIERAQRAEQAANEAGGNDDALRRTLLLAQRTADLAVQEAREQAARIVASAEQQAQSLVGEADQRVQAVVTDAERRAQSMLGDSERRSQSMVAEAEQRARRGHEDTLVEVRAELAKLEATRQRLYGEVDSMTRWVAEHRGQLRAALEDALTRIEQIDVTPPAAAVVTAPPGAPAAPKPVASAPPVVPAAPAAPVADAPPVAARAGADEPWAPPAGPPVAAPSVAAPPVAAPVPVPQPSGQVRDEPNWAPSERDVVIADDIGGADPYFAELRRAISDQDPLGPRSDGDAQGAGGGRTAPGIET